MTLLELTKANLMISNTADDELISSYIDAAQAYAERHQHLDEGYYTANSATGATRQAIVMLASFYYESRDGGSGGYFGESPAEAVQVMDTVDRILALGKDWRF